MHSLIFPTVLTLVVVSTVTANIYQRDRVIPGSPFAGVPALGLGDAPVNVVHQGGNLPVHGGSGRSDRQGPWLSDPFVGPVSNLDIVGGPHKPIIPPKKPIVDPKKHTIHPKKPTIHLEKPIVHPKKPIVHPKKPIVHPKKPIVHPKKPIVHPKKPIVHPKKPIVHPKKPINDPFKSIDPFGVGGFHSGSHKPIIKKDHHVLPNQPLIDPFGPGDVGLGFHIDPKKPGHFDHRFKKPNPEFPKGY